MERVKLNRTDMVKKVAAEMQVAALRDVEECRAAVAKARREFRACAVQIAHAGNRDLLDRMAVAVCRPVESVHGRTNYNIHTDEQPFDRVQVVFTDHEREYEGKLRLVIEVAVRADSDLMELRGEWVRALEALAAAEARDTRMSAMNKDAREKLVKDSLESLPSGVRALAAFREFADELKAAT